MRLLLAILLLLALPARATELKQIAAAIPPLPKDCRYDFASRGATPAFVPLKRRLREWAEIQLATARPGSDLGAVEERMNEALRRAVPRSRGKCPESPFDEMSGFGLPRIRLAWLEGGQFLLLTTGIGIACGWDESAYVYIWSREGWQPKLRSEQDDYRWGRYSPRSISGVKVSAPGPDGSRLVLELGVEDWCTSLWHKAYFRLWRLDERGPPSLLVDDGEFSYNPDEALEGSETPDGARIRFLVPSLDVGVLTRPALRSYVVENGHATRGEPIALTHRDFVEEWLQAGWQERRRLTAATSLPQVTLWQAILPDRYSDRGDRQDYQGRFDEPQTCDDERQVIGIDLEDIGKRWFTVARPGLGDRFEMVSVSDEPAACAGTTGKITR